MRDQSGRVVIMDFGLARTLQGDGMTQTGMMVGTMEYMSPEQAMGKELDARSDQFAVGLIFYELLTGYMPFSCRERHCQPGETHAGTRRSRWRKWIPQFRRR